MIGSVDVYTFRASVEEYPEDAWRTFQILSCATVGQLGAAVLAAFESLAYHTWYIVWNGVQYEYIIPELTGYDTEGELEPVCPDFVTLRDMSLLPGDTPVMEYDSAASWVFLIEMLEIRHAEITDQYLSFPKLVAGSGGRMIEDVPPQEVARIIAHQAAGIETLEDLQSPKILRENDWDWTNTFDMGALTETFRANAKLIELGYQDLHPEELMEICGADEASLAGGPQEDYE